MPDDHPICIGHDFNLPNSNDIHSIMSSMLTTGFQATNLGRAINEIHRMRSYRLSDVPYREGIDDESLRDTEMRSKIRARIFLAYTSNQISCGQREVIRYLVQHSMVDVLVTTAGGVEEDIVKCLERTYMGDFRLDGRELRRRGINRIGNLLVPNKNYCKFEDWLSPLLDRLHDEQDERWLAAARDMASATSSSAPLSSIGMGVDDDDDERLPKEVPGTVPHSITPSEFINRLGMEINDESSVLYWAHKNSIPVFCPALTDGSIGDMIYFHSYKRSGFVLDIAGDIRKINDLAVRSHATGQIILGGGIVKHHTCNANLMRNGADYSVYVNTSHEFDGSDSGASPEEAISWGKIRITADPVKVCADATIVFPLLVSQTFARDVDAWKESTKDCVCWIDG
jgi:deoxyhypusine synthase